VAFKKCGRRIQEGEGENKKLKQRIKDEALESK
jgi:hypothetical protein